MVKEKLNLARISHKMDADKKRVLENLLSP